MVGPILPLNAKPLSRNVKLNQSLPTSKITGSTGERSLRRVADPGSETMKIRRIRKTEILGYRATIVAIARVSKSCGYTALRYDPATARRLS
jgi:hypothetical protein